MMRPKNNKSENDKKLREMIDWLSPDKIIASKKKTHNDENIELDLNKFSHLLGALQQPLINEDPRSLLGRKVIELKDLMQVVLSNYLTHNGSKLTVPSNEYELVKKLEYQIKGILLVQKLNNNPNTNDPLKNLCTSFIKNCISTNNNDITEKQIHTFIDQLRSIKQIHLNQDVADIRLAELSLLQFLHVKTQVIRADKFTTQPANQQVLNSGGLYLRGIKPTHQRSQTDFPTTNVNKEANSKNTPRQKNNKTTSNETTNQKKAKKQKHQHHHTLLTPPTEKYKKP